MSVSAFAGNRGRERGNLSNGFPWILTLAAGTVDRTFTGTITLGNGVKLAGWSFFPGTSSINNIPLIYNPTLLACYSTLESSDITGGIIICETSNHDSYSCLVSNILNSKLQVAILTWIPGDPEPGQMPYPGVVLTPGDWSPVVNYTTSSGDQRVSMRFHKTVLGTKPAPTVAAFTSTCPSRFSHKPDVLAPSSLFSPPP